MSMTSILISRTWRKEALRKVCTASLRIIYSNDTYHIDPYNRPLSLFYFAGMPPLRQPPLIVHQPGFARRPHIQNPPPTAAWEDTAALLRRFAISHNLIPAAVPMEIDPPFDPTALGLKEIGNLASWTVSSCKPGCGVEALRDDNTDLFWQSDGPQPHHLNIHFSRLVSIRSIRLYLDFISDESYTPTRITILAGTGYHDLLPFSVLEFAQPKGWIDVPLEHVGGGEDGKTLRAFLVQVKVVENHQNGKDTHLRGLKVYAKDEKLGRSGLSMLPEKERHPSRTPTQKKTQSLERDWLIEPDWMGEPELR
ncbi:anaphase-promoting complex subunit 10 [Phlyctema vagabunda]|uniref:Anaphase-promoting complex subunit 10 n=1 Tax=Phlyctema vagabunda TaxID=108571 RepID=A0ABR4PM49_9HELO